jgi:hypothetical protein
LCNILFVIESQSFPLTPYSFILENLYFSILHLNPFLYGLRCGSMFILWTELSSSSSTVCQKVCTFPTALTLCFCQKKVGCLPVGLSVILIYLHCFLYFFQLYSIYLYCFLYIFISWFWLVQILIHENTLLSLLFCWWFFTVVLDMVYFIFLYIFKKNCAGNQSHDLVHGGQVV